MLKGNTLSMMPLLCLSVSRTAEEGRHLRRSYITLYVAATPVTPSAGLRRRGGAGWSRAAPWLCVRTAALSRRMTSSVCRYECVGDRW